MFPLRDSTKSETFPYITILFILLNLSLHFQGSQLGEERFYALLTTWGLTPAQLFRPESFFHSLLTVYTAMFLHGSWAHVVGNMWMLWLFGDNVEDRMGKFRYVGFYLLCGTIAAMVHCVLFSSSQTPVVGASGAVAGVMGAYFLLFQRASILTFIVPFFFVRIPAVFYLGLWFILQFLSGTRGLDSAGSSVAFWAHVGGFIAGMVLFRFFLQPEKTH